MILKTKRPQFEITLDVHAADLISTPDPNQRNWALRTALDELAEDLVASDRISKRYVPGSPRREIKGEWAKGQANYADASQLIIEGQQVMQDWERPLMKAMADIVTESHGHVLEVGFGMAISATYIQESGVASYTVIEPNEEVIARFDVWKAGYPGHDINLVKGKWQEVIDQVGMFDAIFFDTYPLSEEEYQKYILEDVTFAAHFFAAAAAHLKPGGVFSYYSNEIDSMSRRHQRRLLEHFRSVGFHVVHPLYPPADCHYWWADSMLAIRAVK